MYRRGGRGVTDSVLNQARKKQFFGRFPYTLFYKMTIFLDQNIALPFCGCGKGYHHILNSSGLGAVLKIVGECNLHNQTTFPL